MNSNATETRGALDRLELRAAPAGVRGPGTMVGYAARFNTLSCDLGGFREKIRPGAFASALESCDVRALFNHDPDQLLGRSSAGTLRLAEDAFGLRVEVDLPDTTLGRDVAELVRRGDLQGQSFRFTTSADEWDYSVSPALRTLCGVAELIDVGPVSYPAYDDTTVAMRSLSAGRAAPPSQPQEQEPPREQPQPPAPDRRWLDRAAVRLRLAEAE